MKGNILFTVYRQKGSVANFETKFLFEEQKIIRLPISATTINLEGVVHILTTTRDITERKNAELAIKVKARKDSGVSTKMSLIGIYRTTLDGRILMANPAMVSMLGFDTFESQLGTA